MRDYGLGSVLLVIAGVILACGIAFGACAWNASRTMNLWNKVYPERPIEFWDAFWAGDKVRITPSPTAR